MCFYFSNWALLLVFNLIFFLNLVSLFRFWVLSSMTGWKLMTQGVIKRFDLFEVVMFLFAKSNMSQILIRKLTNTLLTLLIQTWRWFLIQSLQFKICQLLSIHKSIGGNVIAELLVDSDCKQLVQYFSWWLVRFLSFEGFSIVFEMIFDGRCWKIIRSMGVCKSLVILFLVCYAISDVESLLS